MTQPAASLNAQPLYPLSCRERVDSVAQNLLPWNLVADGYAETTAKLWDNMVMGSAPIQMMKKGLGEALWSEKEKLALASLEETLPAMKGPLTSDAWMGNVRWLY